MMSPERTLAHFQVTQVARSSLFLKRDFSTYNERVTCGESSETTA